MKDKRSIEEIINTHPAELAGEIMALRGTIICCENEIKKIKAENEKLKEERLMLAKLSAKTPQFYNAIATVRAEQLRDELLKGGEK